MTLVPYVEIGVPFAAYNLRSPGSSFWPMVDFGMSDTIEPESMRNLTCVSLS